MSAQIQKNSGAGWFEWTRLESVRAAVAVVRDYCLEPGVSFRVLNPEGVEVFRWNSIFPAETQNLRRST